MIGIVAERRVARADDEPEDDGVDDHQEERVDERPEEPEDGPAVARLELAADEALDQHPVLAELLKIIQESRPIGLSSKDPLHLGRIFPGLLVDAKRRQLNRGGGREIALRQEPPRRVRRPGADEAQPPRLQSARLPRPVKIRAPGRRIHEVAPAVAAQRFGGGLHYIRNIAADLMLGHGFLRREAEVSASPPDVRRVGKGDIERLRRFERPEVRLEHGDPVFEAVEEDVPPGQRGQRRLELERHEPPKGPGTQEKRDHAVPRAELQNGIARPDLDEIRQKRRVHRESVSALFLDQADPPVIKGIQRFVFADLRTLVPHLRPAR